MPRAHRLSALIVVIGLLCVFYSSAKGFTQAWAHPQLQPPRPTLTPTQPTPKPTHHDHDDSDQMAVPSGRITGTVIDETTGAPVANIPVTVGDHTVMTDANGNYDRSGLPAGDYTITLMLNADQGESRQPAIAVKLAAGATLIQHLRFRSPMLAVPIASPTALMPVQLPTTGGSTGSEWGALGLGAGLLALGVWMRRRQMGWSRQTTDDR